MLNIEVFIKNLFNENEIFKEFEDFSEIQFRMLNLVYKYFLILAFITAIFLSIRTVKFGSHIALVVIIIALCGLSLTFLLRNKLPYKYYLRIFIGFMYIVAVNGLYNYGLNGAGILILTSICFLIVILGSKPMLILSILVSSLIILTFGILNSSGKILYPFELGEYSKSFMAWFIMVFGFLLFTIIITSVTYKIKGYLLNSISNLKDVYENQRKLNDELEHQVDVLKETRETLEESEQKYKILIEQISYVTWAVSQSGKLEFISSNVESVTGYKCDDVYQNEKLLFDNIHTKDKLLVKQAFNDLLDYQIPLEMEYRFKKKNGSWIWMHNSCCVSDDKNRLFYANGIMNDITEKKQAQVEIQRLNQLNNSIVENTNVWLNVTDKDFNVILWNRAAEEISGYKKEEVLGNSKVFQWLWPDKKYRREEILNRLKQINENDLVVEGFESKIIVKAGDEKIISWYSRKLIDSEDKKYGTISLGMDITDRKNTEVALKKSEEKYRLVTENIPDVIWVSNVEGKTSYISANVKKVFGYSAEEILREGERLWFNRIHPDDAENVKEAFVQFLKGKSVYDIEYRIKRKDGNWIWLHDKSLIKSERDSIPTAYGIFSDITYRKKIEDEKNKLEEQLIHAQKMESIGRMAGGIAHDFNNILTGILGYAELLGMELGNHEKEHKNAIEIIVDGIDRAQGLTKQILGFAKGGEFNPVPLDLNRIIQHVLKISENLFEKKVNIFQDLTDIPNVIADRNNLDQVFTNLLINAKDAMPLGGDLFIKTSFLEIDEELSKRIPGISPGEYCKTTITDTGTGIQKEVRDKIFDPFFTTKGEKGTGLGLATSYGIIKKHKGHISVYSEPEHGTTFSIYLPVTCNEEIKIKNKKEYLKGTAKILLIDDEKHIRDMSEVLLKDLGYKTYIADNGFKGVEIFKKNVDDIDLVLLDIIMPEMDGTQVFRQLKKIRPEVKVIITSGFSDGDKISELRKAGAVGFLPKPYSVSNLTVLINKVLYENKEKQ